MRESLLRILALTRKELITLLVNKKSRLVLVLPPIAQLIVFGYAANFELNNVPVAIYNQDQGSYSRQLLSHFQKAQTFHVIAHLESVGQIAPVINDRKALMVIHILPDFSRKIMTEAGGDVQVVVDGRNSNVALIALNYLQHIIADFNMELKEDLSWKAQAADSAGRAFMTGAGSARLVVRSWFNEMLDSHWFIIPGIVALLTIVVTLEVTALSVAKEREAGTFDQLLVTPFSPLEILIGKSLPGILIGIVEATFIIVMIVFWFKIPLRGSIPALYLGLFTFVLSAVGIGLMISSISVTQQQGLMGAFLFLVPSVILSGFATPISNMPEFVQDLTYLNPMRYILVIVRAVFLQGAGLELLWQQYIPMAAIGIISLALAGWLFRKRLY